MAITVPADSAPPDLDSIIDEGRMSRPSPEDLGGEADRVGGWIWGVGVTITNR